MNGRTTCRLAGALILAGLTACNSASPASQATGSAGSRASAAESAPHDADVDRAALDGLGGKLADAREAASTVATANAATKAEAAKILIGTIDFAASDAWRTKHQPEIVKANQNAGITATDEQLDSEMRNFQDEEVAGFVALAPKIGGAALVAKCFVIASGARPKARQAARDALDAMKSALGPDDAARLARLAASAEPASSVDTPSVLVEVGIAALHVTGGTIANAESVVAGMNAGFRRCYHRALSDAGVGDGSVAMEVRVGPSGEVTGASPTATGNLGTAPACIAARASSASFAAPTGGESRIEFVVKLVRRH